MVSAEEEGGSVMVRQPLTTAYLGGRRIGQGTLCIADRLLSWQEDTKRLGFSLLYPNISLHAIRRDPIPSLYMMIDHKLELPDGLALPEEPAAEREDSGGESNSENDEQVITELMFAPEDQEVLQILFSAMAECQAMHPDPNDSFSDEDDDIYEDASGVMEDEAEPNQLPMLDAEGPVAEEMEGLHIDENNHPSNNGDMDCDPEQFLDD